jgi:mitochondrial fission protein ELM1
MHTTKELEVWGLVDDRTGHRGQVLGVLSKLAVPYVIKNIAYNRLAALPNALLGAGMLHVCAESRARLRQNSPDLIVAAGRRTIPVLRYMKAHAPSMRVVYLMDPKAYYDSFDLIAIPEHDHPVARPNVITTEAPLHAVTQDVLGASRVHWHESFKHLPRPWVAVCLGGNTRSIQYQRHDWQKLARAISQLAGDHGSVLITSSRRTPSEALDILREHIHQPNLIYDFKAGMDNPYLGFLACADALCVTGDSLSMCAEATASGKPVYIYAPDDTMADKYTRLHKALFDKGVAEPLAGNTGQPFFTPKESIDDTGRVVAYMRQHFSELF